jgi:glycerate kinase
MGEMRVLVAPDKLKGSLSAVGAAEAISRGLRKVGAHLEVERCPVADGGEGTLDVLIGALGGEARRASILGPHGREIDARFGFVPERALAIVESAEAVGLAHLAASERNPLRTTSFGLGQLIRAALDSGARTILVGLGGSSTTDAGAGMAQALGVRFGGASSPMTGGDVEGVNSIDTSGLDPRIAATEIVAACDVDSPLTGVDGAALTYGTQKGATAEESRRLDASLAHFASLLPGADPAVPGAGAAGGLGFGLSSFLGAELVGGADSVLDALSFDARVGRADLVLTAEGRLDGQSARGKVVAAVARRAARLGVPSVALAGSVALDARATRALGLVAAFSLCNAPTSEADAMANAASLLEDRAAQVIGLFLARRIS